MKGKWAIWSGLAVVVALAAGAAAVACGGGGDNKSTATTQPAVTQAPAATTKLILDLDTVRGPANMAAEAKPARSCVQASKIPLGGQVVWRIKVIDPRTGSEMDDKALASVIVKLADGQTFTAKYGGHPAAAPVDSFWATSWTIPATYPTGAVDYTVTATDKEGRTGVWNQMKVASAMLTIVPTEPWVTNDVATDTFATR